MRLACRAGLPLKFAQPDEELKDMGGDFPHYTGQRSPRGNIVIRAEANGTRRSLRLRLDLRNHSPTGFEWGYEGSGPAQLALAMLADYLADDAIALELYQDFKRKVVAAITTDRWTITGSHIRVVCDELMSERAGR